jgi:hypothetical protein
VFGRCLFRVSARASAVLSSVVRGFSQSLQVDAGMVSLLGRDRFLPGPFQLVVQLSSYHPGPCIPDADGVAQ